MRSYQITLLVLGLFLCGWLLALNTPLTREAARQLAGFQIPSFSLANLIPPGEKAEPQTAMDVVFVLDTTGSMGGLIEGAKMKIWSIINHLNQYQPQPELRIGLVAFRDRGDIYVTRHTPLSQDLDAIYSDLMALRAAGGGDTPESVNQALYEAVTQFQWNPDPNILRMVFLVGDAPPHMHYDNDVLYSETGRLAMKKDILINTIQCGTMLETTRHWKEIAQRGGGEYAQIRQDGGMVAISAPQDKRIAILNREISATVVPYGDARARASAQRKVDTAQAMAAPAAAERQVFFSRSETAEAITGREDLVGEVANDRLSPDHINREWLPEDLAALSAEALKKEIDDRVARRNTLQKELSGLLSERESYLREKRKGAPAGDAFDDHVQSIIQRQAAAKLFTHSIPEA